MALVVYTYLLGFDTYHAVHYADNKGPFLEETVIEEYVEFLGILDIFALQVQQQEPPQRLAGRGEMGVAVVDVQVEPLVPLQSQVVPWMLVEKESG